MNPENCLNKLRKSLYASWDSEAEKWVLSFWRARAYSGEIFEKLKNMEFDNPYGRDCDAHVICMRVLALFDAVRSRDLNPLFLQLHDSLQEIKNQFGIDGAQKAFERTNFVFSIVGEPKTKDGVPLGQKVAIMKRFPRLGIKINPADDKGGVLDFREWRKSKPCDYQVKVGETESPRRKRATTKHL